MEAKPVLLHVTHRQQIMGGSRDFMNSQYADGDALLLDIVHIAHNGPATRASRRAVIEPGNRDRRFVVKPVEHVSPLKRGNRNTRAGIHHCKDVVSHENTLGLV